MRSGSIISSLSVDMSQMNLTDHPVSSPALKALLVEVENRILCSSFLEERQMMEKSTERIRRPMNAFMVWARRERKVLQRKYPHLRNIELSKILGDTWKTMDKSVQQIYIDEAMKIKEQHKRDHPNYKYRPRRRVHRSSIPHPYAFSNCQDARDGNIARTPSFYSLPGNATDGWLSRSNPCTNSTSQLTSYSLPDLRMDYSSYQNVSNHFHLTNNPYQVSNSSINYPQSPFLKTNNSLCTEEQYSINRPISQHNSYDFNRYFINSATNAPIPSPQLSNYSSIQTNLSHSCSSSMEDETVSLSDIEPSIHELYDLFD